MKFEWDDDKNRLNKEKHGISYTIEPGQKPTEEMLREVREASLKPIVYDEDCPEMSETMMKVFQSSVVHRNRKNRA